MKIALKKDLPDVVKISRAGYHREFKRAEQPFDTRSMAAESLGPPPGVSPALWKEPYYIRAKDFSISEDIAQQYAKKLESAALLLGRYLLRSGLFDEIAEPLATVPRSRTVPAPDSGSNVPAQS